MRIHNTTTPAAGVIPGLLIIWANKLREVKSAELKPHGKTLIYTWDGDEIYVDNDQELTYVKIVI